MVLKKTINSLCIFFLLSLATSAVALDNVRVAYPSPNTGFWYLGIAQKEDYFKHEGLNVELINMRGDVAVRTALAGEIDFLCHGRQRSRGGCKGSANDERIKRDPEKVNWFILAAFRAALFHDKEGRVDYPYDEFIQIKGS